MSSFKKSGPTGVELLKKWTYGCRHACTMPFVRIPCLPGLMFNEIEGGGSGGRSPPAQQGGLGGRRPPNDQCDKFWVRVYVPVRLLKVWVTKIF